MNLNRFFNIILDEYYEIMLVKKREGKNSYSYFTYNSVFGQEKVYCVKLSIKKRIFFIYVLEIEINQVIKQVLKREL